jgi:hypothetical protein
MTAHDGLPEFLTHYYRDQPFRSLSHITPEACDIVLANIAQNRSLDFRLTRADYLPRRRHIEQLMRDQFIAKAGRPKLPAPHYAILGTFSPYEDDPEQRSITIPVNAFRSNTLSFTFTDSFFAFSETNLRGIRIPSRPYHRQVFHLEELPALVDEHGLPGDRWRTDESRRFDVYIEAQIWDETPLKPYLHQH